MITIAILSGKGGTGKTTLVVHLAVASVHAGRSTAVIDLDPQPSARMWKDARTAEMPVVVSAQAARLDDVLQTAEAEGVEWVIIDTAPHAEAVALAAARAADVVLIPCRPAIFDLRGIATTVDLVRLADVPALAVLNAVPARGRRAAEATDALSSYDLPTAPCHLGHRVAYVDAVTAGLTAQETDPKSKAAKEILSLYNYINQHIQHIGA